MTVSGGTHHVGVVSLTATSATIEVSSDPQQATLNVGESQKFELDGDDYYDVSVTLDSIAGDKAKVTTVAIHDLMPGREAAATEAEEEQAAAEETVTGTIEKSGSNMWIWIIAIVVVVIIIGVVWSRSRR